jgi:hypothetical protein
MTSPSSNEPDTVGEALSSVSTSPGEPGPVLVSPSAPPPAGPPEGFGRGVNDYFNHYIGIADAKAAGFLAAALTVGAAAIALKPTGVLATVFYWLSVAFLGSSGVCASIAIFPRLPRAANRGLIFWEEVRVWPDAATYQRALSQANGQDIEFEYAAQNRVVSDVLHDKHVWVRRSIALFMIGTATAVITFIISRNA